MFYPPLKTDQDYKDVLRDLLVIHQSQSDSGIDISASVPSEPPERRRFERGVWTREDEGKLATVAFCFAAGKNRLKTANPEYQSLPFDSIAISRTTGGFKLSTVQVKATSYDQDGIYPLNVQRHDHKLYLAGDFDFAAVLIVPLDYWYIIPFHALPPGGKINLHPHGQPRKGKESTACDRYLNRWDLLR